MNEQLALDAPPDKAQVEGPVECLGLTFKNDEKRRAYFLEKLHEKLKDPEFRRIEGFPIGSDEDILAMSDPPFYTACPNPFLEDFITHYGRPYDPDMPYSRKPFAVDVSEGKTDSLYKAHAYHTKVPHLAIVPSILHYTEPGDIVLDGFCGSGMTGVAAQWCGTAPEKFRRELEAVWEHEGFGKPAWGPRRSVQCDLSPAATFIAANYNLPFDVDAFVQAGRQLLDEIERELGWMYETLHTDDQTKGRIEYTVWSEVFSCPNCAGEVVFLDEALDEETKRVRDTFSCPHCGANLTKDNLERVFETRIDPADNNVWKRVTFRPSLISYVANGKKYEKKPDEQDRQLIERITQLPRDGMYFLPDQAAEYDKKRLTVKEVLQLEFFVTDETSAIQWLKQQLTKKPQTFQELHPQFLKEIGGWQKHEKPLELSELLEENFLRHIGTGEVPSPIHSYLSTNFKELRNLSKEDPALRAKAKDRWYVPDPNKAGDLEKLRERTLLREFWEYLPPGYKPAQPESQAGFIPGLEPKTAPIPQGKQFRVIRMEAVRVGFAYCYRNRDYRTIIAVARRIPESILQEDQKLLMWYDQALTRTDQDA